MIRWSGYVDVAEPKVSERSMIAASAKGFANGAASRFAFRKFQRLIAEDDPIFICMNFGLVDADAGLYFRKYVKDTKQSVEADLAPTYRAYVARVKETMSDPDQHVVFKGLNPTTITAQDYFNSYVFRNITKRISQEDQRLGVADRMRDIPTTIAEHAANNCEAAEILRDAVESAGYEYFDLRAELSDPEFPGLAARQFLPAQHDNHVVDSLDVRVHHRRAVIAAMKRATEG